MRDYTHVETIYCRLVRTVQIKIDPAYVASTVELQTVSKPYDVYAVLKAIFDTLDDDQEHFVLLVLNLAQEVTGYKLLASGGQEYAVVDCKILFRSALLLGASGIILAHNHPTGKLDPSPHDLALTAKVVESGRVLDIEVLDHIVYTPNGYTSIRHTNPELFGDEEEGEEQ